MIACFLNGKLEKQNSYREAFHLQETERAVISVVGAGGKTTTIRRLSEEYVNAGIPVIVMTSTHMMIESQPWFLLEESIECAKEILKAEGQLWVGVPAGNEKMKSVSTEFYRKLLQLNTTILIEADGAKRLPLKAPGEHEPVLFAETTHVLCVYGLDAVGSPIVNITFRFETVAKLLNKSILDCVEADDIAVLGVHKQGGRKGVKESQKYQIVLNKADTPERVKIACQIAEKMERLGMDDVVVTSYNG